MNFTVIICTFMRPKPLLNLLKSIKEQKVYPNEILIIDGSLNEETKKVVQENNFFNLKYFLVTKSDRGLTRQRNYGISRASIQSEIICFLDDDTILKENYFEEILKTYSIFPNALGVGGYINNEVKWEKVLNDYQPNYNEFVFDGWKRKDGSRFIARKKLGLDTDTPPGFLPEFSNGRSIGFLPPSGKIYEVEQLMGGVSSFKRNIFDTFKFSTYFEGYGLYEDADFTLRLSKVGKLYINTNAQLGHFHDNSGRPNKFKYGKMVVRNGWYVWRVKYPKPSLKAKIKWNTIVIILILVRFLNVLNTKKRKEALSEGFGRIIGWLSLIFNKPKLG